MVIALSHARKTKTNHSVGPVLVTTINHSAQFVLPAITVRNFHILIQLVILIVQGKYRRRKYTNLNLKGTYPTSRLVS
jgi:hypothetical protein